jgi:hypothetical protein
MFKGKVHLIHCKSLHSAYSRQCTRTRFIICVHQHVSTHTVGAISISQQPKPAILLVTSQHASILTLVLNFWTPCTNTMWEVKQPHYRPTGPRGFWKVKASTFRDIGTWRWQVVCLTHLPSLLPRSILVLLECNCQIPRKKSPVTPAGIGPATFRLVA